MGRLRGLFLFAFGYFVLLELMLAAAILYWPNFEENLAAVRSMASPIPALSDILDTVEETGALGYIMGQHFFKGCNTLGTAAAVLFASGAVAGEVHRGTLELLLARPQSRARILLERWLAGALALAIPVFLTSLTIPWLAARIGEDQDLEPYMLGSVHQTFFLIAVYGLSFLMSALGSNPTRIALIVLFATTFEFAIYMIKVLTHWSLFRLADIEVMIRIADDRALDWGICGPLVGAIAVLFAASLVAFRRRVP